MKRMKSSKPKGPTNKWVNLCPYDGFEYTHIGQFVTHAREYPHPCLICLKCDHVSLTREQATIHSSSYDHRSVPPEAHPYQPIDRDTTISVTPLNHPPIDFHVRVLERVEQLKQRIEAKLGCQKKSQSLLFGCTEMEDTHTLLDYGVLHGNNISLIVKLKGGTSPGLEVVADPSFEVVLRKYCYNSFNLYSDGEGEISDADMVETEAGYSISLKNKLLPVSAIESCKEQIMIRPNHTLRPNVLNAYRVACHFGTEDDFDPVSCQRNNNSATFCGTRLLTFEEADVIFRKMLGNDDSKIKTEPVLVLKNAEKRKNVKPLIKSYIRIALILQNHTTDGEIPVFSLTCLRAATVPFAASASLLQRLIKVQQNIKFVQKRGCEAAISPDELETIEPFLENETCSKHYPIYSISCQCIGPWAVPNVLNQ